MIVFWISLTLWLSNNSVMRGIFQVSFGLIRLERTRLEELREARMIGEGVNEGINGIQGEFQMGMKEREGTLWQAPWEMTGKEERIPFHSQEEAE